MAKRITLANIKPGRVAVGRAVKKAEPKVPDDAMDQPERLLPMVNVNTPITPRAMREQILSAINAFPEERRATLVKRRLTALDQLLTSEEAAALEQYATDEENFEKASISRYDFDQVDSSPVNRALIEGARHVALARHMFIMTQITTWTRVRLHVWSRQMNCPKEAPTAAQAAYQMRMVKKVPEPGRASERHAADAWHMEIRRCGKILVEMYQQYAKKKARHEGRAA